MASRHDYRRSNRRRFCPDSERGSGVIATLFGAVIFLGLLLFAVNVIVGLYAASVTSAVADDAVRRAAASHGDVRDADAYARAKLSSLDGLELTWDVQADQVGLRVRAVRPSVLPAALLERTTLTTIDRTSWARVENAR